MHILELALLCHQGFSSLYRQPLKSILKVPSAGSVGAPSPRTPNSKTVHIWWCGEIHRSLEEGGFEPESQDDIDDPEEFFTPLSSKPPSVTGDLSPDESTGSSALPRSKPIAIASDSFGFSRDSMVCGSGSSISRSLSEPVISLARRESDDKEDKVVENKGDSLDDENEENAEHDDDDDDDPYSEYRAPRRVVPRKPSAIRHSSSCQNLVIASKHLLSSFTIRASAKHGIFTFCVRISVAHNFFDLLNENFEFAPTTQDAIEAVQTSQSMMTSHKSQLIFPVDFFTNAFYSLDDDSRYFFYDFANEDYVSNSETGDRCRMKVINIQITHRDQFFVNLDEKVVFMPSHLFLFVSTDTNTSAVDASLLENASSDFKFGLRDVMSSIKSYKLYRELLKRTQASQSK